MAEVLDTHCGVCGAVASGITLLAPGEKPAGHEQWDDQRRALWDSWYAERGPRLVYDGIEAGSGSWGSDISEERAQTFRSVLGPPLDVERIRELDLFDDASVCIRCGMPYCRDHWNLRGASSLGTCPQGHFKSLDPY